MMKHESNQPDVRSYLDEVYRQVVPHAAHVTTDTKGLSSPTPALVELLAWNVGIAFLVNVLASAGYDLMKRKFARTGTGLKRSEEIEEVIVELQKSDFAQISDEQFANAVDAAQPEVQALLEAHGLPQRKAKKCVTAVTGVTMRVLKRRVIREG